MNKIAEWYRKQPKSMLIAALFSIFIYSMAIADYLTGYAIVVSVFYLVPIFLAVWLLKKNVAFLIAIITGIVDVSVSSIGMMGTAHPAIFLWNTITKVIFYLAVAYTIEQSKDTLERERALSRLDPLTGLLNSRAFFEAGNIEISRSHRYKHPFSLAYIDVDNFKFINDTLGHSAGDDLLRELAKKIRQHIRTSDVAARIGGDEFAILFPETDAKPSTDAIDRIRAGLINLKHGVKAITFSVGVVTCDTLSCAFDEVVRTADGFMYSAKKGGKNAVKSGVLSGSDG